MHGEKLAVVSGWLGGLLVCLVGLTGSAWAQADTEPPPAEGEEVAGDPEEGETGALDSEPQPPSPTVLAATFFERLFEREALGFEVDTLLVLHARLEGAALDVVETGAAWVADPLGEHLLALGLPLLALGLLFVLWWADRRLLRRLDRTFERIRFGDREQLRLVVIALLRTVGRLLLPSVVAVLWYVVIREIATGLAAAQGTSQLVGRLLVLWLIWRGSATLMRQLIHPGVIEMTEEHARLCCQTVLWAVRAYVGFQAFYALVAWLGGTPPELALIDFGMRLALALVTARLVLIKSAVMDLLPDVGPAAYLRFRSLLERFYHTLTGATTLLLLMWAFGYERAALNVLWRLYAALGLLVVGGLLLRRMVSWLERERNRGEQEERRLASRVLDDAAVFLRLFAFLLLAWVALVTLGLYGPVMGVLGYPLFTLGALQVSVLTFAKAGLVLLTFLAISRAVRTVLEHRLYPRLEVDEGLAYAANATVHYLLLVLGALVALLSTGIDLTVLGVFLGALGIGVGLGLQELVRDVVAGFVLLFGRAVKKGDFISAPNGNTGLVERVGVRSVTIRTRDHLELLIPTSHVVNGTIVNYSHSSPLVRTHVAVGVSYKADPKVVREVLIEAALESPYVAKRPQPVVWLSSFGDSSVNYEILVWHNVKRQGERTLRGEMYFVIWDKLYEAGIEIPFPQRDLHIKSVETEIPVTGGGEREKAA